jgi:AhpD family alkylhydroperoxidase
VLKAHESYFDAVMNRGTLDRKLKEKVAFKVARLNDCEYSTASHYRYALKCGATEEEMTAVEAMITDAMTPQEAAALELAVKMNASGKTVTPDLFDKLGKHFSPSEIIELLAAIGLMVFASRLADSLDLKAEA